MTLHIAKFLVARILIATFAFVLQRYSAKHIRLQRLYHKSADKTRVIFRLHQSDINNAVFLLIFRHKTCESNTARREPNITANQHYLAKTNKTAQLLIRKLGKVAFLFFEKISEISLCIQS